MSTTDNRRAMAENTSAETISPTLVVGIAASAEGVAAVRCLLSNLPSGSGLAFILVLQDPIGSIAEDLRPESLTVQRIDSQATVKPDHLYVTGADVSLAIREGALVARPAVPNAALKPVDAFLISLARNVRERSAAVLLSGTEEDGVMGMKEISEAGGLCIVQAQEDAAGPSTPQRVIAAGITDHVAPAAEIVPLLLEHARSLAGGQKFPRSWAAPSNVETGEARPSDRAARMVERHVLRDFVRPCIAVNRNLEILHFFGHTDDYLLPPKGTARLTLRAWARPSLFPHLRAAITRSAERGDRVVVSRIAFDDHNPHRRVTCTIDPIRDRTGGDALFLIAFEESVTTPSFDAALVVDDDELRSARDALRDAVEELEMTKGQLDTNRQETVGLRARIEELKRQRDEIQTHHEEDIAAQHELVSRNKQLESARDELEDLLRSAGVPIIVLDVNLRVRRFTPAATRVMRLVTPDVGRSIEHVKERFADPDLTNEVERVIETLTPIEREVTTDEARVYIRRILPYWTDEDRIAGVCIVFTDITARKQSEDAAYASAGELERQTRRKDGFIAMLGHELRNPLGTVANGLNLLESARNDPDRSQQVRAMMRRQTARIRALLDQLLDVSGVVSGHVPMAMEPVDIVETVTGAVETVHPLFESRRQRLETSAPAKGGTFVQGDEVRLTQVIEHLLTTAANHSRDEGLIRLTVEPDYDEVRITVSDDGVAIEDEQLQHIFEVFARGDDPLRASEKGLGLSLPLARELVMRHGGAIEAKRAADNGGIMFLVTLPRLQRPPSSPPAHHRPSGPQGMRMSLRILVVDDETDAAASLADVLKLLGHNPRVVHDGPSALGAVRTFEPEIILLDLGLPGMDGYEVAQRLRDDLGKSGTLLVALTGYPREARRLEDAGFDHHLIKPVDLQKLQSWLGRVSDERSS